MTRCVRRAFLLGEGLLDLLLVDYTGRLFREGKARISAELAGTLERIGSSAESWQVRMEKLRNGRSFGRFFAASREKLRELARRLKVRHLVNLFGDGRVQLINAARMGWFGGRLQQSPGARSSTVHPTERLIPAVVGPVLRHDRFVLRVDEPKSFVAGCGRKTAVRGQVFAAAPKGSRKLIGGFPLRRGLYQSSSLAHELHSALARAVDSQAREVICRRTKPVAG